MYKVGKEQYQEKLKVLKLVHLDVSDRVVQAGRKGLVMTWEVMTGVSHDGRCARSDRCWCYIQDI